MKKAQVQLYTATVSSVLTVDLDAEGIIERVISVKGYT